MPFNLNVPKMNTDSEHKPLYGESGLPAGSLEPGYTEKPTSAPTDDSAEIGRALEEAGFLPEMQRNKLFAEYYRKVATGPGTDWDPYRRARFTLQVMNRAGCIEWPVKPPATAVSTPDSNPERSAAEINELLDRELSRPRFSRPFTYPPESPELFDDYNVLTKSELKDNLIVMLSILGLVILTGIGVYFAILYSRPAIGAAAGGGAVVVGMAVASRLGRMWHNRFTKTYSWVRILVCAALLFTKVAWNAASSAYSQFTDLFGDIVSGRIFGLILCLILTVMTIVTHLKLNRTYSPSAGKTLGWVEALCLTFAVGAFLFSATAGK